MINLLGLFVNPIHPYISINILILPHISATNKFLGEIMAKGKDREKEHSNAEKPISLKPLEFDEAVSDLLKVKPEPKDKSEPETKE